MNKDVTKRPSREVQQGRSKPNPTSRARAAWPVIDPQNRLFAADHVNSRIRIFGPRGRLVAQSKEFGRPAEEVGADDRCAAFAN
jgi:hypothetical protein